MAEQLKMTKTEYKQRFHANAHKAKPRKLHFNYVPQPIVGEPRTEFGAKSNKQPNQESTDGQNQETGQVPPLVVNPDVTPDAGVTESPLP